MFSRQKTVAFLALIPFFLALSLAGATEKAPFHVRGSAALLGDIDSGTVLLAQNDRLVVPPASLTKLMTLYLVYEALIAGDLTLDTKIPVSEKAWRMGGSKTFVKVGDHVRVEDLIRGVAVQSGNDACVVLAEFLAGSEAGFADMMNNKARELGMTQTHYVNATGMPDPDHVTSARDLFLLSRSIIINFPKYSHYSQEKQYTFNGIRQYNRNRLLWRDPSITGLKTGHTKDAGYCLIATNAKDGQRLVAVVLGAKGSKVREEEALRMLRHGNRMFETVRLFEENAVVRKLHVWKGDLDQVEGIVKKAILVTVPRKERGALEVGLVYDEPLVAPLTAGQQIGSVVVKLGNKEILTQPVVSGSDVAAGGIVRTLVDSARLYLGW